MQRIDRTLAGTIVFSLLSMATLTTRAQDSLLNSLNDTAQVRHEEMGSQAPPVMDHKWNQIRTNWFTLNFGMAFLLDHNIVNQDENNFSQVGDIPAATEFRGERFVFTGTIRASKKLPWRYMISANFNGMDAPPGKKTFDFVDWSLDIPLSAKAGWITLGKQKEGVGHEYVAPGTQLQFMERATGEPMFVRQRNIGIRYSNSVMKGRMSYTIGFFNNYWETGKSFSDNGSQITARVTGLPHYVSDRDLIHVGVGYRHTGSTDGKLSYKAKPEVNTAPSFISTGSFDASGAGTIMLEGIYVKESITLVGEYMSTSVKSESKGNPRFSYYQVGGGWFITGENRRYNKQNGNLGKLIPKKNFKFRKGSGPGAIELASRYTHTDGTDAGINGGVFNRFTIAASWYVNPHFRYEINYGRGWLKKNDVTGNVNIWQFRAQFEL
jgi:phosphate-selective porin OprO/OprP